MSDVKGNLEQLIDSPGWQAFTAFVTGEWGAGGRRFESTIDKFADSREEDRHVLDQIRQIAVARREILRLIQWPSEELARLKTPKAPEPVRAPLDEALVGQSRRGM